MAEQPKSEWQEREIGAFWTKKSKKDEKKFWSGHITVDGKKVDLVMYPNDKKTEDKHPSLRVYIDKGNPNKSNDDDFPA